MAKDICTFEEAAHLLGLASGTLRDKAKSMGLTVVDLNDVLPKPIKNHLRLIKSEVESLRDRAVERAIQKRQHVQSVMSRGLERVG